MSRVFFLSHAAARANCAAYAMQAPEGWRVLFSQPVRNSEQNSRMHAMIGDIAKQYPIHGKLIPAEDMKRVLVSAFKIDTKDDADLAQCWKAMGELAVLPGLRGEFVVLGDQTRRFPKKLVSAFIEWLYALGDELGIVWSDPSLRRPAPVEGSTV